MKEIAYSKLEVFKKKYPVEFSKTVAIIGGTSSDITRSILRFVNLNKKQVVGVISSAISLNNEVNFCRVIADEYQQALTLIMILQNMKWNCAIGKINNFKQKSAKTKIEERNL